MSGRPKNAWRRLYVGPTLAYDEWLACAATHPDQNAVWREHEDYGRGNEEFKRRHPETYDMGGES